MVEWKRSLPQGAKCNDLPVSGKGATVRICVKFLCNPGRRKSNREYVCRNRDSAVRLAGDVFERTVSHMRDMR